MTGYCDVFYRCRGVDPDTPLVRLKNCIVTGKCAKKLASFLEVYTHIELVNYISAEFLKMKYSSCRHTLTLSDYQ